MKRLISLALVLACLLTCVCLGTASASARDDLVSSLNLAARNLNPNDKCPLQPAIYCSPRYKDPGAEYAYDLRGGLSIKKMEGDYSGRKYGLYFKFTPRGRNRNYLITRIDWTIKDKKGNLIYVEGFDTVLQTQAGYYWYWNFFDLDTFYKNLRTLNGGLTAGSYRMDIYFNRMWAGKTNFTLKK